MSNEERMFKGVIKGFLLIVTGVILGYAWAWRVFN